MSIDAANHRGCAADALPVPKAAAAVMHGGRRRKEGQNYLLPESW